jgi:hypothetical protein
MKKILIGFIVATLAGCAASSGVLRAGPDTFTVKATASPGAGGGATAKRNAYTEASQECAKGGKQPDILSEQMTDPSWTDGMHAVNLVFSCK